MDADPPALYAARMSLEDLTGRRYWRMDGLGNEFVIVDLRGGARPMTADAARTLGDRSGAFGCDQVITLEEGRGLPRMGIWNADGSEAGACGNAARCVAWLLMEEDGEAATAFASPSGVLMAERLGPHRIAVDMGEPKLRWDQIPLAEAHEDTRYVDVKLGPIDKPVLWGPSAVSMGNPHCVFFVEDVATQRLDRFGPLVEHHPLFPEGVNVSVAQVRSRHDLRVRTWERGVGLTKACGTAACAALVSASRRRLTGRKANVELDGGALGIEWREEDGHVIMAGAVRLSGEGTF
nr:diaminopimelate epimerase [Parvularcula dongshanensis]